MEGSVCIQRGSTGETPRQTAVSSRLTARQSRTARADTRPMRSRSPCPRLWDRSVRQPTAKALGMECTSQLTLVLVLTAAVAASPRWPTMAVSTYWRRVPRICWAMAGAASCSSESSTLFFSSLRSTVHPSLPIFCQAIAKLVSQLGTRAHRSGY